MFCEQAEIYIYIYILSGLVSVYPRPFGVSVLGGIRYPFIPTLISMSRKQLFCYVLFSVRFARWKCFNKLMRKMRIR